MQTDENKLYNELKIIAKRANQRILRLEKLTGKTETFAVKQLYDYLDSSTLQALSSKGRIRVSKKFSDNQLRAIINATNQFLKSGASTIGEVKQKAKEYQKLSGKAFSLKQADVLYKASRNYSWVYNHIPKSEFWAFAKVAKTENWDKKTFKEQIVTIVKENLDEFLKHDLDALYYYIME